MLRFLLILACPCVAFARGAPQILEAHCHRCHGQDGANEGGFNYALDFPRLAARGKVVPGEPDKSPLWKRIGTGTMPPPGEPRMTPAEIAAVKAWIAEGKGFEAKAPSKTMSFTEVQNIVLADLERHDRRSRRFQRYFTLSHLANAGFGDGELQTLRNALNKLVNSLSWHPAVRNPEAVDPARTVFRIDLRWYLWDAPLWNRILNDYPYGILDDTATNRAIVANTGTKMPILRADWFTATASRAPLYYDLLQLPGNLAELEKQLRIDAASNIQQDRVQRAGFNGSGISRFNRILERHDSVHGAYWRTYDFDEPPQNLLERVGPQPADRRNVFAFPLGPGQVGNTFAHAGGEAIFALPNGLHGYILVNAANGRIDKGPIALVSDPKRPDRAVEAGVSCMGCHVSGILPKADQVRVHAEKNAKAFSRVELELVKALYPPSDALLKVMQADADAYAAAVAKTGARVSKFEAVGTMTLKYEADLDLASAASEVGLSPDKFRTVIEANEALRQSLGALRIPGGTISRPIWVQNFGELVRTLKLGELFRANVNGPATPDNTGELDPLEAQGNVANAVAFAPDGKRALIASADRSVRIWDVEANRDAKRLVGHTASVWAVAFNPKGTQAASGSMDGTARTWDSATGQELKKFTGHLGLVSAVAFGNDGAILLTGGYDGAVIGWDAVEGHEIRRLENKAKTIHALAIHPTEKVAAIAADDGVILWNFSTGDVVKKWKAHSAAVTCIAFAKDGKWIVTGSDDRTIRVWNLDGTMRNELAGHDAGIRSAVLRNGERWLLSASSDGTVKLWDLSANKEVATFRKHSGSVAAAAFLPSGRRTLSIDRELGTRIWDIQPWLQE
jgi:WD40 repeat protein